MANDQRSTNPSIKSDLRMLWIDGVGGYLIASGDEWLIGGPGAGDSVEINIQGDLSRRAAAIRRQGSDYVLQPLGQTLVEGNPLDRPALLRDADVFQLGGSVKLEFKKPHPLSASARLNFASRHRLQPRADGIILLADTCVIGPSKGAHISCPHWDSDVIIFVGGGVWQIRSDEQLNINDASAGQRAVISAPCRIHNDSIAMTMELAR